MHLTLFVYFVDVVCISGLPLIHYLVCAYTLLLWTFHVYTCIHTYTYVCLHICKKFTNMYAFVSVSSAIKLFISELLTCAVSPSTLFLYHHYACFICAFSIAWCECDLLYCCLKLTAQVRVGASVCLCFAGSSILVQECVCLELALILFVVCLCTHFIFILYFIMIALIYT